MEGWERERVDGRMGERVDGRMGERKVNVIR